LLETSSHFCKFPSSILFIVSFPAIPSYFPFFVELATLFFA